MKTSRIVKASYIILTLFSLSLLAACGQQPAPKDKRTADKEVQSTKTKKTEAPPKEKQPSFPKPHAGQVKKFFLAYGEENPETLVLLKTRLGDIKIRLYDETPIHRANFVYNVKQDLYHQTIFYRVVPDFMIQGGNSDHPQTLEKREEAGSYYIPNEAQPGLLHKRGTIAMAMSYNDNPDRKSAQYSYYIVIGTPFSDAALDAVEEEYEISIPESSREVYRTVGGTPHLDGVHTVFGEVVEGMDLVEAISNEKRDSGDWPITDVIIEYEILK